MAQPTPDQLQKIVDDAAKAIEAGVQLTDIGRFQAAGTAVKLASDQGHIQFMEVVILAAGGQYAAAAAALMDLALTDGGSSASSFDPLAGLSFDSSAADATQTAAAGATASTNAGGGTRPTSRGNRTGAKKTGAGN